MSELVGTIIVAEWELFDRVHNRGGRAACQDDRETFFLMRSAQLSAWTEAMQESYYRDLCRAREQGRNLLSEKYGYMMARTSPEEYEQIRGLLPPYSEVKTALIGDICQVQVEWQEELSRKYPRLIGNGRVIHRAQDGVYSTSFETYLWGELESYSIETVRLYSEYVNALKAEGRNLNEMILANMVSQYGYSSLEAAESRTKG